MNQICVSLVELLCQTIAEPPAMFMSLVPTMRHGGPTKVAAPSSSTTVARRAICPPFMNQSWVSLLELLCQTTVLPMGYGLSELGPVMIDVPG